MARGSRNASIPYLPYSRPTPEYLNPPQGACGSSVMALITTRPARICEATRRARWRSVPRTEAWRPYLESLAIRIANDSKYGLHASVLGTDLQRARRVASQIRAGR